MDEAGIASYIRGGAVYLKALDRESEESPRELTLRDVEVAIDARRKPRDAREDWEKEAMAKFRLWPLTGTPALRHALAR